MLEVFTELSHESQKKILVEQINNIKDNYNEINELLHKKFVELSLEERTNIITKLKNTRLVVSFCLDLIELSTLDEKTKTELVQKLGVSYTEEKNILSKIK